MGLNLEMNYDDGFSKLYNKWNGTDRGKKFLELIGISRDKLDIVSMSKLYFSRTNEDRTIDVNANVGRITSPNNYQAEVFKGLTKLNGLYLLWEHMSKKRGEETANRAISGIINGDYYFHDLTSSGVMVPYCFAWASNHVMLGGRKYGQLSSKVPKRSDSFIAVCIESIFDMAQEQMGALAIPDFIVNLSYFYNKEGVDLDTYEGEYKVKNDFQRIIHSLNQQYRISNQSAFTNFSLFDREIFKTTFADYYYPDGTSCLDLTEYIQKVQEIYIRLIAKKDPSTGLPYRFPVNTLNIYVTEKNEIIDKKFFELSCKYNVEGLFNIFISKGKAKLASCCFSGDELIKIKRNDNWELISIKNFVEEYVEKDEYGTNIKDKIYVKSLNKDTLDIEEVLINGVLKKRNSSGKLIEIETENGSISITYDHILLVKDIRTNELKEIEAQELINNSEFYEIPIE